MKLPENRFPTKRTVKNLKRWVATEGSSARTQSVTEMAAPQ